MLMKLDDIHYSFRRIDGTERPFCLIVSAREAGKTTSMVIQKMWSAFKKGYPTIVMRRQIADVTELYIDSFQEILNMFIDEEIKIYYKLGDVKSGTVKAYCVNPRTGKKELFFVVIGLSQKIQRIKSNVIRNNYLMIFDEYIINPQFQEKYLPNEFSKLKEVYTTFKRYYPEEEKAKGKFMKIYFMGNPYTSYSPFTEAFNIDYKQMKPGAFLLGDDYAIENYELRPELIAKIQKENPFYRKNDEYTNYALHGLAINDMNIRLGTLKNGYALKFLITFENTKIGIYRNTNGPEDGPRYFCKKNPPENANKDVYCFSFDDLVNGNLLYNRKDNASFEGFKIGMRRNDVEFDDIGTYYKIREVYTFV